MRRVIYLYAILLIGLYPTHGSQAKISKNGFLLDNALIPTDEIHAGGPPRDGIPSIDKPVFITTEEATFMRAEDRVLSVDIGNEIRAYPLRILVWHEIVNDRIGGVNIVVTYCPLCGTAMVFNRNNTGKTRTFGVSGLLYNSDMLMYDRETKSLWSQLMMQAISGPAAGEKLLWLPSQILTWKAWKEKNPQGKVLSTDTGHRRDYTRQPYTGYEQSSKTYFPVKHGDTLLLRPKEWIVGAIIDKQAIAFHLKALPGTQRIEFSVEGNELEANYNSITNAFTLKYTKSGIFIPVVHAYAFAWHAFYPQSIYWKP